MRTNATQCQKSTDWQDEYSGIQHEFLENLVSLAEDLGKTPTSRDMAEHGPHSVSSYHKYFGGWNNALDIVGLEKNRTYQESGRGGVVVDRDEAISLLREFAEELGHTPTKREMDSDGPLSCTPFKRLFGSWNNALREADLAIVSEAPDLREGDTHHMWDGEHPGYYGPNWEGQRRRRREMDSHECQMCGTPRDDLGQELDVHHKTPLRCFIDEEGDVDYEAANRLQNLVSLCRSCHIRIEQMAPLCPV